MTDTQPAVGTAAGDLLDRYTLPKVALALILVASLVGTWVTTRLDGGAGVGLVAAKWAYFAALGVLAGGLVWKHVFVRPADAADEASGYCRAMYDRFDSVAAAALAVVAVGGAVVLADYLRALSGPLPAAFAGLLAACLVAGAVTVRRSGPVTAQFRSGAGLVALVLALALVTVTAVAEAARGGFSPAAAGVRVLHLLAFSLWVGGAVWNIFVAVPVGAERRTVAVVRAAGQQLERFRWAVRAIIPTLFLTGLYQAAAALGHRVGAYLGSAVGLAVLLKVGLVAALVVVFKLCPMWRACSPVEGVCDLADGPASGGEDD